MHSKWKVKSSMTFLPYPAEAAACLHSSHTFLSAEYLTSRPASRSRWCCRCRPGEGGAWFLWCPSPWQCRRRWSYEGREPPASSQPWSRLMEGCETGKEISIKVHVIFTCIRSVFKGILPNPAGSRRNSDQLFAPEGIIFNPACPQRNSNQSNAPKGILSSPECFWVNSDKSCVPLKDFWPILPAPTGTLTRSTHFLREFLLVLSAPEGILTKHCLYLEKFRPI